MSLHLQPVGPLRAATYWRRRVLVVLLVAAVAVAAVTAVRLAGERWSADDRLAPRTEATSGGAAQPEPTPTTSPAAPPPACPDEALEVQATADAAEYPVGASATLTLTVRNTGAVACTRALGQGAVELVVTSGEDRIWSSDDCAPGGGDGVVVLMPGASQAARATWPGTRSAVGCPPDQAVAQPGTYRVTGRVGELLVPGAVFRVRS